MKKPKLPEKTCIACGRPFNWRRKWTKTWDGVKYCSNACGTGTRAEARKAMGR